MGSLSCHNTLALHPGPMGQGRRTLVEIGETLERTSKEEQQACDTESDCSVCERNREQDFGKRIEDWVIARYTEAEESPAFHFTDLRLRGFGACPLECGIVEIGKIVPIDPN